MPRELREWIAAYLEDLPNFICDYTEASTGGTVSRWKEQAKHKHQGEVRYLDGIGGLPGLCLEYTGCPWGQTIWEVTTTGPHSFHAPLAVS